MRRGFRTHKGRSRGVWTISARGGRRHPRPSRPSSTKIEDDLDKPPTRWLPGPRELKKLSIGEVLRVAKGVLEECLVFTRFNFIRAKHNGRPDCVDQDFRTQFGNPVVNSEPDAAFEDSGGLVVSFVQRHSEPPASDLGDQKAAVGLHFEKRTECRGRARQ